MTAVRAIAVAVAFSAATGCERKAPGPRECVTFSYEVLGVTPRQVQTSGRVKSAVDELTAECLTTPYDRALLDCVRSGNAPRGCYAAFRARLQRPSGMHSRYTQP
jgi:hypothetical protein